MPDDREQPMSDLQDAESGSLTLMLVVLLVALLALAGLVLDGGAKLNAASTAAAVAQEAARAGAGQVSQPTAYSSGSFVISQAAAINAARHYLATAGYRGTVQVTGPRTIRVTVTIRQPTKVLSLIGISSFTVTESATATLVAGVTGPGS
jgi:Flp pilus assembly protein TadG